MLPAIDTSGDKCLFPSLLRQRMSRGLGDSDLGQLISTDNRVSGILLAVKFQHCSSYGIRVGRFFNVFAAPRDMKNIQGIKDSGQLLHYREEVERVASLRDFYGHDGISISNELELLRLAEESPETLSSWHIPTLFLMEGRYNPDLPRERLFNEQNMYALRDTGAFEGTFTKKGYGPSERPDWYRTLKLGSSQQKVVWKVNFGSGEISWMPVTSQELAVNTRVVRCEPV